MSTDKAEDIFQYDDRLDQESFRLLEIKASGGSVSEYVISCQLHTFPREDSPKYVALSYAWNEPLSAIDDQDLSIILNGYRKSVSANLYQALRHLANMENTNAAKFWWIDALCINQTDPKEQTEQVMIMHKIYRKADTVIVWLGADFADEAYQVREFLRALLVTFVDKDLETQGRPKYEINSSVNFKMFATAGMPDLENVIWKYVVRFWDRAWFNRTWVTHEVAVAHNIEIYCGRTRFTSQELVLASRFFIRSGLSVDLMLLRGKHDPMKVVSGRKVGADVVKIDDLQLYANGVSFIEADDFREAADRFTGPMAMPNHACLRVFAVQLFLSRRNHATDPRDKVFALLVLMKQVAESYEVENVELEVNYLKTLAEVYQEATAWVVLNSRCLGILSMVSPDRRLSDCLGLCSWIPDFREDPMRLLRAFGKPDPKIFTIVPSPELSPAIQEYDLFVSAKHHSTVADVGDSYESMMNDGCYELSARTILNCPLFMPRHNNLSRIEVWRRTLCGRSAYASEPDLDRSKRDFFLWLAFYVLRAMTHSYQNGLIGRYRDVILRMSSFELLAETDESKPSMLPRWAFWERATMGEALEANDILARVPDFEPIEIGGRRLFRMRNSSGVHLGYGPEVMEEDDEVWVAAGAALPLVLRPRAQDPGGRKTYAFVGEAYMIDVEDIIQEVQDYKWQRLTIQ